MRNDVQAAVTICGKRETSLNVGGAQIGEIFQHLGHGHSSTEIIENVSHGNARAPDTGLTTPDTWINRDTLTVVHAEEVTASITLFNRGRKTAILAL